MKFPLRSAMYLCLAIATVAMLSAGSVAAVHSTTGQTGSGTHSVSGPSASVLFDDGPTNGTLNGLVIDGPGGPFGQQIIDGFVAANSGTASSLSFGMWVPTGTAPELVTWYIGTSPYAQDIDTGFEFLGPATNTLLCVNGSSYNGGTCAAGAGFDIYEVNVTGLAGHLTAGST